MESSGSLGGACRRTPEQGQVGCPPNGPSGIERLSLEWVDVPRLERQEFAEIDGRSGMSDNPEATTTTLKGQCLCGAVTLSVQHRAPALAACHCSICRKWGGGPYLSVEAHQTPAFKGDENIAVYDSSEWAQRGFCRKCGSHLFYRLKEGGFYALSAGLFRESSEWPFKLQVFIDEKPGNYAFANSTREMTGEEVFKAWSPDQN